MWRGTWGFLTMCGTAGEASKNRSNPRPHAPGGARWAGRADPAETGTRNAPEGTGWFTTCGGVLREEISMRYRAIHAQDRRDPIRLMCRALSVSAAGSDAWRSRPERT